MSQLFGMKQRMSHKKMRTMYNSIDLFTRLNEGKIPLTDAELIKALLLQSDLYPANNEEVCKQRLFEIASEWDEIEAGVCSKKCGFL